MLPFPPLHTMNKSPSNRLYLAVVLVAFGCLGFAAPQARPIDRVSWLTGCWEARNPQCTIYEQWTSAHGRAMLSTARTLRGDTLIEYEFVALRERGERLSYVAHAYGQSCATFASISFTYTSI